MKEICYGLAKLYASRNGPKILTAFFYLPEKDFILTPITERFSSEFLKKEGITEFIFPPKTSLCFVKEEYFLTTSKKLKPLLENLRSTFSKNLGQARVVEIPNTLYRKIVNCCEKLKNLTDKETEFRYNSYHDKLYDEEVIRNLNNKLTSTAKDLRDLTENFKKNVRGNLDVNLETDEVFFEGFGDSQLDNFLNRLQLFRQGDFGTKEKAKRHREFFPE